VKFSLFTDNIPIQKGNCQKEFIMNCKKRTIPLGSVDADDHTYRITTETGTEDIARSIRNVGLMCPPLLIGKGSGFIIVCGFRRIFACLSMGWSDIEAGILDADTQKSDCAELAVTDNVSQRPLNLIETSRAFHLLSGFSENDRELADAVSALGFSESPSVVSKIKKLCQLPESFQKGVLSNTIAMPVALELGKLGQNTGLALADMFNDLRLSLNKQREILMLLTEIARREDRSIPEMLGEDELGRILNDENTDRNRKAQQLRACLKARRFPAITRAEKIFERHTRELCLGAGLKLIPPPHFEGTVYTLHLHFQNHTELKARTTTLDRIIHHPALEKILNRTEE